MHGHDRAGKPCGHEVVQDLGSNLAAFTIGPTTATTRGAKKTCIDAVAAAWDRAAAFSEKRSVTESDKTT